MSQATDNFPAADHHKFDLVVVSDRVVLPHGLAELAIAVQEGRIVALTTAEDAELSGARKWIDARGLFVMPGIIDAHVHFRSFNDAADGWGSVSRGAALSGITTFIPYVQGPQEMQLGEMLRQHVAAGEAGSMVDFALHCRLNGPSRDVIGQLAEACALGVHSFKLFMAYRKRGLMWDGALLYEALEAFASLGATWCCHAENGDLIDYLEDKAGAIDAHMYASTRPVEAEVEAASRALQLCRHFGVRLYLVHTSVAEVVELAERSRALGNQVVVETCPQYLTLTNDDLLRFGSRAKIAPPLRGPDQPDGLWRALRARQIDVVASDHAPWPRERKEGAASFADAAYGAPGLETLLPVMYTEAVVRRGMPLVDLVRLLAETPATVFGLSSRKGRIAPGMDADLVIFDPGPEWQMDEGLLHTEAGYSNWHGWPMKGRVVSTLVRGQLVAHDGKAVGEPGFGRFLPRALPSPVMEPAPDSVWPRSV